MPHVHFTPTEPKRRFGPLPPGKYLCRVDGVEEKLSSRGDVMWKVRFSVCTGAHKGRWITDHVLFSEAAQERLAIFCAAFGIEPDGDVNLHSEAFVGQQVFLDVQENIYVDRKGEEQKGNKVAWDGFRRAVREGDEEISF